MATLRWTAEAEQSLRDVYKYIAQNRPTTAKRTIESILNRTESLREAPTLGQPWQSQCRKGVRRLTYGQFQIAYLFDDSRVVVVLGVFHGFIFLPLK